jgi:4-amino-4-deoxy-L-arabinose transferase-like glycosyltransferase
MITDTRPAAATLDLEPDSAAASVAPPEPISRRRAPRAARPHPAWLRWPSRSGWIVAVIAVATAVLYTWKLSDVGFANSYYTAAVKSASVSWKAFFFGAIDPGSFITVDKPPAALWVQALSVRVLGFSTFSMLVPQVLAGVASVLILHRLVRRWAGDVAAHIAAITLALTPVAVEMFRYNNPDALLTLLCLGAAWGVWSAVESGRTRGLVVAGSLVGLAFNTKMLQAFLVLPAFVLVYLVAGKPKLGKRILQLGAGLAALVVSSSWWVAIVALWPEASRPYIGSTSDNNILSLVFGYNGLSRIFGGEGPGGAGPGGGPGGGGGFGGTPGVLRLFNLNNGGQISWLLPFAVISLAGGLWMTRRANRTDRGRAGWLLWGGWAAVCYAVFSFSTGIFHEYYSVQLAPAVAALVGAGAIALWRLGRRTHRMQWLLPVAIVITAGWAVVLLDRTPSYHPWLRTAIPVAAAIAIALLFLGAHVRSRAVIVVAGITAGLALLAAPAAYAITTVLSPESGPIVSAGPSAGAGGFPGAGFGGGGFPGGGAARRAQAGTSTTSSLVSYLEAHRNGAKYLVAAFGSQSSAPIIIESGAPVITIGGFNGGDPAPTLAQLQDLIARGEVRSVLVGGAGPGGGGPGGAPGGSGSAISQWVTAHGTQVPASEYGGANGAAGTLYDVSSAT